MEELSDLFKAHIEKWTNAWNNKDLKTVLSMFADNIQFSSPKIKILLPELNSEKIDNKKDLERYWSTALEKFDTLHFTPKEYFLKGNTCVLEYIATFDGKTKFLALEESEFNDDNLIYKALAFYEPQID
jgi:ketosteroid isomerase-like protein